MAKILPDGRIQVEKGDTLSGIYGATWKQDSGYTGDPKKLPIGTILPAKKTTLGGTLPPGDTGTGGGTGLGGAGDTPLPETPTDNLASFRTLLQTVSQRAKSEAQQSGVSVMGFDPSKVSGGTLSGILGVIDKQKTTGIADIYKQTTDFLDNQQKQAQDQLKTLIDSGAIANLTDSALTKLASMSGMDLEQLTAIKTAKTNESKQPKSFSTVTKNGKQVRIGFDAMGNVISETVIGDKDESNMTEAELKRQAVKEMETQLTTGTDPETGGPILGQDGKISPKNWKKAKQAWIKQMGTANAGADFDAIFEQYQNPNENYD